VGSSANREASIQWTRDNMNEFMGAAMNAAQRMFMKHAEEEAAKGAAAEASVRKAGRSS
jgi:hypothetical protein